MAALFEISSDVLGLSKPANTLLKGLGYGISATASFLTSRWRNGVAIQNFTDWERALGDKGAAIAKGDLTLSERSEIQVRFEQVRSQSHKEAIGFHAVEAHREALIEGKQETGAPIDDEWLENFWGLAARISSEQRQQLWGKILSRESLAPGTVSVRTLKFMADLTPSEATKLEAIASCAYYSPDAYEGSEAGLIYSVYQVTFAGAAAYGNEAADDLSDAVLPARYDTVFVPAGFWLTISGFAQTLVFPPLDEVRLRIGSQWFAIRKSSNEVPSTANNQELSSMFNSMQISAMGREVIDLINAAPSKPYVDALSKTISFHKTAELVELSNR